MKHLDPEAAALLALGEPAERPTVRDHLDSCADCRAEVDALRETVSVARSTLGEPELLSPPPRVWDAIRVELGLAENASAAVPSVGDPVSSPASTTPVASLSVARARRAGRIRRFVAPVVASAAAAALIVAAALTWNAATPREAGQVLASAQLQALPAWGGSSGFAELAQIADGERVLRVSLDVSTSGDGVREVWLLTAEVDGLISLGLLEGTSGEFIVPETVDLERFSVVDVSQEPLDGDPTHSGNSIVRGPLGA